MKRKRKSRKPQAIDWGEILRCMATMFGYTPDEVAELTIPQANALMAAEEETVTLNVGSIAQARAMAAGMGGK